MKIGIFTIVVATALLLGMPSCSDNLNEGLTSIKAERTLNITVDSTPDNPSFTYTETSVAKIIDFTAAPGSATVSVESNTRWMVEVLGENSDWCEIDAFDGSDNGTFNITVSDNMQENRNCVVRVSRAILINGAWEKETPENTPDKDDPNPMSIDITVNQVASQVRLFPSSLEPFPAAERRTVEFSVTANDVNWTLAVTYDGENTAEFVNLLDLYNMQETTHNLYEGSGDATFTLEVPVNRTAANRVAFLTLSSPVGNYTVEISQLKSEYTFNVSPEENQIIGPDGGTIDFGILSQSDWKIECKETDGQANVNWITFDPSTGGKPDNNENSQSRQTVKATINPNETGKYREAIVQFIPTDPNYSELSVTVQVAQRGYDLTFHASPVEELGVVMVDGGQQEFAIDSRFNWEMTLPDWVSDVTINGSTAQMSESIIKGSAAEREQLISFNVTPNTEDKSRQGTITIKPLPTPFGKAGDLNPETLGIEAIIFTLVQFGGRQPAISSPWVLDGYQQTSATVVFNFYSPFYSVTETGLKWRKQGSTEWTTQLDTNNNVATGTCSTSLEGLEAATKYEARGYVKYTGSNEIEIEGPVLTFTTAGQYPGEDDNPFPDI